MMLPHEPMSKREEEDRRMVNLSERLWLPVDTSPVMIILLFLLLDVILSAPSAACYLLSC